MTLSPYIQDNEKKKFVEASWSAGLPSVASTSSLVTALDEDIDSIASYDKGYTYTRLTADGVVSASAVGLCGYYVEASSSGVISFYDNASAASGSAMMALSKAVITNDLVILPKPISLVNGLYFDLVSGTATVSILTRKTVSA